MRSEKFNSLGSFFIFYESLKMIHEADIPSALSYDSKKEWNFETFPSEPAHKKQLGGDDKVTFITNV